MKESKRDQTHQYFQLAKAACQAQISALQADHRTDEAVFVKIQLNVLNIFHSILSAGENTVGEDDCKLQTFFLERWDHILRSWKNALEKAEQHQNVEAVHIETMKLDMMAQIGAAFKRIWREEP